MPMLSQRVTCKRYSLGGQGKATTDLPRHDDDHGVIMVPGKSWVVRIHSVYASLVLASPWGGR